MNYRRAIRHLERADPVMRRLIEAAGPCRLERECQSNQFAALVDSIIYQQLAYQAAATISRRFRMLYASCNGAPDGRFPTPAELLGTSRRRLRAVGLSRQKLSYLVDLARKASDGTLRLGKFGGMSDDQVVENLTRVKGIGRWTAEMFLIFSLRRPDVLPVDDLGVRYAFKQAYRMRELPSAAKMHKLARPWRPYRTVATWYLWRSRRTQLQG